MSERADRVSNLCQDFLLVLITDTGCEMLNDRNREDESVFQRKQDHAFGWVGVGRCLATLWQ